ncbi:hypothetical protein [Mycobacteroides abscessus]|uniref:hypothetical protein n=1 Tax=Mycobacteroides abscessus TaxID=36809 RepID=UPI0034E85A8D
MPDDGTLGIDPPLDSIDVNPPPELKLDTGFEPPEGAEGKDVGNEDDAAFVMASPEGAVAGRVVAVSAVGAVAFSPVAGSVVRWPDLLVSSSLAEFEVVGCLLRVFSSEGDVPVRVVWSSMEFPEPLSIFLAWKWSDGPAGAWFFSTVKLGLAGSAGGMMPS